jgi:hypothetical protein
MDEVIAAALERAPEPKATPRKGNVAPAAAPAAA